MSLWTRVTWFSIQVPAGVRLALDTVGAAAVFALATAVMICSIFGVLLAHRPDINQLARVADQLALVYFVAIALLGAAARRAQGGFDIPRVKAGRGGRWSRLFAISARAGSLAFPLCSVIRLLPEHAPPATTGAGLAWVAFALVLYPCALLGRRRQDTRRAA